MSRVRAVTAGRGESHHFDPKPIQLDFTPTIERKPVHGGPWGQIKGTVEEIAGAILRGAEDVRIRNHAAALASKAGPKDYHGQLREIWADFINRWRYVRDPIHKELLETHPDAIYHLIIGKGRGLGFGRGGSDCDGATVGMGAMLASIGFPVRIVTMAPPRAPSGFGMTHVYPEAQIGGEWITVDPVVHPKHGLGYTAPASRRVFWNLQGKIDGWIGNFEHPNKGVFSMQHISSFEDYDQGPVLPMEGLGDVETSLLGFVGFGDVGLSGFGHLAGEHGIVDCAKLQKPLMVEVGTDDSGLVYAPNVELTPNDLNFVKLTGAPYHGMWGLSEEGEPVVWDQTAGMGGWFRKLFKRVASKVRKIAAKVKSVVKKVIRKIPGGKALMKIGSKIWSISKKLVKPLLAKLGPIALKLAPIAALVPGVGTAVSAGLLAVGTVNKIMQSTGVRLFKDAVSSVAKLKFESPQQAAKFQAALKNEVAKAKAIAARGRTPRGGDGGGFLLPEPGRFPFRAGGRFPRGGRGFNRFRPAVSR